jgi:hypothetical protein
MQLTCDVFKHRRNRMHQSKIMNVCHYVYVVCLVYVYIHYPSGGQR